jgi:hypothetical protein
MEELRTRKYAISGFYRQLSNAYLNSSNANVPALGKSAFVARPAALVLVRVALSYPIYRGDLI